MERKFTAEEEIVLRHFFTNTDRPVYCATDNLPTALWSFLVGGYSRSQLSLRERFLAIFEEMRAEVESGRLPADEAVTVKDLAFAIQSGTGERNLLAKALVRAASFMSKWAVEYGHNSLKDGATDRFAIEGLSQRATKIIEASKLAAFQEKSTRYLDFSLDTLKLPDELLASEFGAEAQGVSDATMADYAVILDALIEHCKTTLPREDFKTEAAWIRTAKAKAFDSARYLLPLSVRTCLGVTMPSRETERMISALLASRHSELREIGAAMLEEGVKVNPGLLRHVRRNDYLERCNDGVLGIAATAMDAGLVERKALSWDAGVRLAWITPDLNALAGAVTLMVSGKTLVSVQSLAGALASGLTHKAVDEIALEALKDRGPHDEWPAELAIGQIGFDIVMDFGAYRDLQRHRVGLQLPVAPTAKFGYVVPPMVLDLSREHQQRFVAAMERMSALHAKVHAVLPDEAEYLTTLGHLCRFTYACDLRQFAYLVELRTGPSGHVSYRQVAQEMARLVMPHIPSFASFLRVDWSGESDRRIAEERTQAKLAELRQA